MSSHPLLAVNLSLSCNDKSSNQIILHNHKHVPLPNFCPELRALMIASFLGCSLLSK